MGGERTSAANLPESIYPPDLAAIQAFETIDGKRISFFDSARRRDRPIVAGGLPTLLMVHGNLTSAYVYHKLIAYLSPRYRCVAPDLTGFGMSDKPSDSSQYSLEAHIDAIGKLVARLELEDTVLVGHDWGGPIGLGAALGDRRRYRGLVILNTLSGPLMRIPWQYRIPLALATRSDRLSDLLIRRLGLFQRLGLRRSLDTRSRRIYARANHDASTRVGIATFPRLIPTSPDHSSYRLLSEIYGDLESWEIPALVLFSDRDLIFSAAEGRALAGRLRRATFAVVHGAHHFVQDEAPDIVARAIDEFTGSANGQILP